MANFAVIRSKDGQYDVVEIHPMPFDDRAYTMMLETIGHAPYGFSVDEAEEYRSGTDFDRGVLVLQKQYPNLDTLDVHTNVEVKRFKICYWNHEARHIQTHWISDAVERIIEDREADVENDIVANRFEVFGDYVLWVEDDAGNRIYDNEKEVMQDIAHSY